jgi:hypothetical protein
MAAVRAGVDPGLDRRPRDPALPAQGDCGADRKTWTSIASMTVDRRAPVAANFNPFKNI